MGKTKFQERTHIFLTGHLSTHQHYCNEFGHFIRECSKKNRDENKTGHFNGMSMDYYEDDRYTGEDYDDDDVFATLNS